MSKNNIIADCVAQLCAAASFGERFAIYTKYMQLLNFEGSAYSYAPLIQYEPDSFTIRPETVLTDNYPCSLIEEYFATGMDQYDVSIKKVKSGDFSVTDYEDHKLTHGFSPGAKQLESLVKDEYGLLNSMNIPAASASAISVVSVFTSERCDSFKVLRQENLNSLIQITQVFHAMTLADAGSYQRFVSPFLGSLKPNERKILTYLSSGKPFKNIKDDTGISYRYASNILDALRARLGGINRDRLLYLSGLLNISEASDPKPIN